MARKRSRSEGYVLSMVPAEKGGKDPELTTAGRHLLLESLDSDHRSEQSYTQVAKNSSGRMNVIGEEESKAIRKPSGFPIGRPQSVDIQEVTAGKEGSSDSKLRASRETKGSTDNRVQPLNLQTASRLTVDSNETSKSRAQRQQQQVKTAEESCCGRRLAPMDAKAVCHAIDKGHSHQSILTPPGATADRQPVECSRHESRVSFKIPAEPVQQSKQLSGQDLCQDLKASKSSSSNQRSFKGIITGKQEAEEEATSDPRTQRRKQSKSFAEYNMGLPAAPEKVDKPPIVLQTSDTKTEAAVVATTYRRSTSHGTLHGAEEKPSDHSRTPVPCLSTRARISPADQRDARKDQQQVVASSSSSADSAAATPSDIAQGGINLETTRTGGKLGTRSSPKAKWPPPPQTPKKPPKKTNDGD